MTATATLDRRLAADLRPPRKARPFSAFARVIRLPDGPSGPRNGEPGDLWVPETEPTQIAFLRHVESGEWNVYVVVAPSQRGKTLKAILAPTLYHITERREATAYVLPSLDLLEKNWSGKIRPAIEGTGFGDWLPIKGPGSKGGRPAVISLRDPTSSLIAARWYFMAMGKGGNESATASVTAQHIMIDEADDAVDAGQLKNTCKRIESWGREGSAYVASTVNDRTGRESPDPSDPDAAHPILVFHKSGSRHRQHHRCPHCLGHFAPELEHIDLDRAAIVCPLCSVIWSEADRKDALNHSLSVGSNDRIADGKVVPGEYDHRIYSELTTGLDYHMGDLASIVADIRAAKAAELRGDYSLMKTVMHKIFCRSYVEPSAPNEITNTGLSGVSSRSDYDKRTVPNWVTHLCAGVDVQGDRLYWIVAGIGPDDRWCVIDWGYEMFVPAGQDRTATPADRRRVLTELDAKFNDGWQIEGRDHTHECPRMSPLPGLRGVDVGFVTDEIVSWLRGMRGWRACRGVGKDALRSLGKIVPDLPPEARAFVELRQPDGWPLVLCNVMADTVRRWIHAGLMRDPYTPASGMLPRQLKPSDMLCLHLSGEVDSEDKDGKTYVREVRVRHDLLDALIYAMALSRLRQGVQTVNANRQRVKYGRIGSINRR